MIQGASSGVGLMGLQIAKLMGAKLVIGTSTNDARRARLKEFGADLALDTRDPGWPDAVLKATDGKGVNLVVDMLSGPVVAQTMKAMALLGRIVNVGRLAGTKAEFDFDLHALRRIDYIGVTFRTRTLDEVREIGRRMRADLWDCGDGGQADAADRSPLPARSGGRSARAYAREQALRKDRADDVSCRLCRAAPARRRQSPLLHRAPDVIGDESAHVGEMVMAVRTSRWCGAGHPLRHVTDGPDRFLGMLLVTIELEHRRAQGGERRRGAPGGSTICRCIAPLMVSTVR
jgi:hypothetical protein